MLTRPRAWRIGRAVAFVSAHPGPYTLVFGASANVSAWGARQLDAPGANLTVIGGGAERGSDAPAPLANNANTGAALQLGSGAAAARFGDGANVFSASNTIAGRPQGALLWAGRLLLRAMRLTPQNISA